MGDMVPPDVRLGIVRSISYGLFGKPDTFVPSSASWGRPWSACTSTGRRSSPSPAGMPSTPSTRSWSSSFDVLLRDGRDFFDLFDLHLYRDAAGSRPTSRRLAA